MTDIQHINVDDEQWDGTPRALREHVDKLQRALNELKTERDQLRGQFTETALGNVLAGFKNPQRVKAALLGDKIDPLDTEAVNKWLSENGDDYARATGTAEPPATEVQGDPAPTFPDYGRLNAPSEIGEPSVADQLQAVQNAPKDASPQELLAYFASKGI